MSQELKSTNERSSTAYTFFLMLLFQSTTRSAYINAATVALATAGISMSDNVTSCTAGYLNDASLVGNLFLRTLIQFDAKTCEETFRDRFEGLVLVAMMSL
ncbi:unnamed protein product [Citrullus colocynthis]|uniref:Uncharacterized protein n=1 Tax=Citrullus colocynthis TaxID=252529 RepID=A0ABP0YHJ5_9ROSI